MLIATGIGLIAVLTLATGYFVAQEFAYVAVDRSSLRNRAQLGDHRAQRALDITNRLSFMLSGCQLGITITAILVGYAGEPFLGKGLEALFEDWDIPHAVTATLAIAITLGFSTIVQMVFGELAPKNWAIAQPERLACALSRSTLWYMRIAGPVIHVFDAAATKLLRTLHIEPVEELTGAATPTDLQHIIAASGDRGLLDAHTSRLLQHGLDFQELTVRSAMIPRVDVVHIDAHASAADILELLDSGHTRFPVLGERADDLIGTLGIADLLRIEPASRRLRMAAEVAQPAFVLPESISLPSALEQMREQHHQFACITDEHGAFCGVLTFEDIAEELVGDIRDEDDPPEPMAIPNDDASWTVPARFRLDQLAEATGIELPESDDYETISGVVLAELGRLPVVGETVTVACIPPSPLSSDRQRFAHITVESVEHSVAAVVRIHTSESEHVVDDTDDGDQS